MAKYIDIAKLLVEIKFAKSISEANHLIKQGAVKLYRNEEDFRLEDEKTKSE